jgi:tetratricopeptide (TPR) repeat protein
MTFAAQGRFAEAERALRAIEVMHPDQFEVRYRLGLVLLRLGKPEEAAQRFEAAVSKSPDSAPAWLALAHARLRLGRREAALEAAGRSAKLAVKEPMLWRALAMTYSDAGDFTQAAEFEERWSRAPGADAESRLRLCRLRVRGGDAKRAVPACLEAEAGRESTELKHLLGDAYRLAGDPARAVEAYQRAIQLDPKDAAGYFKLAALFLDHRTPLAAIAVLDNAVPRFENNAELRRQLGLAYYHTGDFDAAIKHFLAVLDLEPDADAGYTSLETLLPMAGARLPEIIQRLRSFRQRRPDSPVGHFLLARALATNGQARGDEVEALLREAARVNAEFWPAQFELSQIEEGRGNLDAAIQLLLAVVKLNPDYAPAHYSLAQLCSQKGDRPCAVKHRREHHAILDRARAQAERAREQSPTLTFTIEPPPAR